MALHRAPRRTLYGIDRFGGIYVHHTATRRLEEYLGHTFMPFPALSFDPVRLFAVVGLPFQTYLGRQIQHDGQVRPQTVGRQFVGPHYTIPR